MVSRASGRSGDCGMERYVCGVACTGRVVQCMTGVLRVMSDAVPSAKTTATMLAALLVR